MLLILLFYKRDTDRDAVATVYENHPDQPVNQILSALSVSSLTLSVRRYASARF